MGRSGCLQGANLMEVQRLLGHSYYGENKSVLTDLFNLLRKGEGPDKRLGLLLKQTSEGRYWVFAP